MSLSIFKGLRRLGAFLRKGILSGARAFFNAVAKSFENFFLIERHHLIPGRFEQEYNRETADLIKAKVKLASSLGVAIAILIWIFGYLLFPYLGFREIVILLLVIGAALCILILNRTATKLRQLRLIGYLLSFALTLAVGGYYIVSPESSMIGVSGFLIALLGLSFIFPWTFRQTYLICFINLLVYFMASHMISRMAKTSYFFFDVMLLVVASIIACAIKRTDDLRRQKEFILNKELAEKTGIIEKDLLLARNIHQSLLPRSVSTENAEISVDYIPLHHIGGDFARVYYPDKNSLTLFICDITGHGVSSALLVNRIHTEIEALIKEDPTPGALLANLDVFVRKSFRGHPMFLSAFSGLLDFTTGYFVYSNCGHPPQLLVSKKEKKIYLMEPETSVIGIQPQLRKGTISEERLPFDRGDRIVLYTDGILEARGAGDEPFGLDRLTQFTLSNHDRSVQAFNQALIERINEYRSGEASDDILLLTVQTKI